MTDVADDAGERLSGAGGEAAFAGIGPGDGWDRCDKSGGKEDDLRPGTLKGCWSAASFTNFAPILVA